MQINFENTQSFGKLRTNSNLFQRLNSQKRYMQFEELTAKMEDCLVDCVISLDKKDRLSAKFLNHPYEIPELKESKIRAFLNLSPIKFIEKMCTIARICDHK